MGTANSTKIDRATIDIGHSFKTGSGATRQAVGSHFGGCQLGGCDSPVRARVGVLLRASVGARLCDEVGERIRRSCLRGLAFGTTVFTFLNEVAKTNLRQRNLSSAPGILKTTP